MFVYKDLHKLIILISGYTIIVVRKFNRLLIFVLALIVSVLGVIRIWPDITKTKLSVSQIPNIIPVIRLPQNTESTIPDWTIDELLSKINKYRSEQKLAPLSLNTKLNNAAKSRLAVITQFEDFEGTQTGVTREKALENVGYGYSWIGDLNLIGFFKNNDPIKYWASIKNADLTLKDKNLKDIGIALKQSGEQVDAYMILASPQKKVSSTSGGMNVKWGGPQLWEAINKRRVELGVNPLREMDGLCTVAAIRLNQLLQLGKLDGHEGFVPTLNRDDLKWMTEKYNISEFLVSGYPTVNETIAAWENTLGHKKLLSGGEYVWGCVYAQNTFAVAITAY